MVEHICYKCNKAFSRKSNYDYHMNKKIPCILPPNKLDIFDDGIKELDDQKSHIKILETEIDNLKLEMSELRKLVQNSLELKDITTLFKTLYINHKNSETNEQSK